MSTLTVADIPLGDREPGPAAAPHRRRRPRPPALVGRPPRPDRPAEGGGRRRRLRADARFLTAGKKLIDIRHEAFRRLTSVRTRLGNYWRGLTLPYTEPGVRLIRQADIESFVHTMEGFREELTQAEADLNAVYDEIKADARRRLGRLYNPADYPRRGARPVRRRVGLPQRRAAQLPDADRPGGLRAGAAARGGPLRRGGAAGRAGVRRRVRPAAVPPDRAAGQRRGRRSARSSATRPSTNLSEFFERFQQLNVRSNPELDALVEQAQQLVRGVTPQELRDNDSPAAAGRSPRWPRCSRRSRRLIVDAPRRRIVRARPSRQRRRPCSCGLTPTAPSAASTPRPSTSRPSAPCPSAAPATSSRTTKGAGGRTCRPSTAPASDPSLLAARPWTPNAPGWRPTGRTGSSPAAAT